MMNGNLKTSANEEKIINKTSIYLKRKKLKLFCKAKRNSIAG